jgi:hypothetical protein
VPGLFLAEFSLPSSAHSSSRSLLGSEWLHLQVVEALEQLIGFHEREHDY